MSGASWASEAAVRGLLAWGLEAFVCVSSSHIAPVVRGLQEAGVPRYLATREGVGLSSNGGIDEAV